MLATYTCQACGDTWSRDLIDLEVQAYIEGHPELADRILSGEITSVDLGEVLCDGCEDYWNDSRNRHKNCCLMLKRTQPRQTEKVTHETPSSIHARNSVRSHTALFALIWRECARLGRKGS